jgi:hypothetical protein
MDALFFHPKWVHVPMALGVLMPLVAGGLLLAWWRRWLPPRGWLVAVALQAVLLASGIVALRSGEAEEERVESVVAERFIEEHEEAAETFVWASGGVLAGMLLAVALGSRPSSLPTAAAATLGTLLVLGLGYRTGEAGGRLVYQHGAARAYTGGGAPSVGARGAPSGEDDDRVTAPQLGGYLAPVVDGEETTPAAPDDEDGDAHRRRGADRERDEDEHDR